MSDNVSNIWKLPVAAARRENHEFNRRPDKFHLVADGPRARCTRGTVIRDTS